MPSSQAILPIALSLDKWSTVADIASAVVTIAAVVIGAIWAYRRFIRERTEWPKANLELVLTHRRLNETKTLLNATVKVHNTGAGKIELGELRTDVHQVLPLTEESEGKVAAEGLVPSDKTEAEWPCIESRKWPWKKDRPEIEPSEHDQFGFDFIVPGDLATAFIYAQLQNIRKQESGRDLVWAVTAFYDLAHQSGEQRTTNLVPGGSVTEDEKRPEPRKEPDRETLEEQREPRPVPRQREPRPDPDRFEKQREPRPDPKPSPQREPRPEPTPESPPPPREENPSSNDD